MPLAQHKMPLAQHKMPLAQHKMPLAQHQRHKDTIVSVPSYLCVRKKMIICPR